MAKAKLGTPSSIKPREGDLFGQVHRGAVDGRRNAAERLHVQSRGSHDDVGLESRPEASVMPRSVKVSIWSVTTEARPYGSP